MKYAPVIFVAVAPLATVAAPAAQSPATLEPQSLRGSVPVSELTGIDVLAPDGRDVGDVGSILMDANGRASLVIATQESGQNVGAREINVEGQEPVPYWEDDQETFSDDAEDFGEVGGTDLAGSMEPSSAGAGGGSGNKHLKIDWNRASYDRDQNAIVLRGSARETRAVAYDMENQGAETQAGMLQGEVQANELIGQDVNLSDENGYGEVEEVLLDPERGEATALVVDSGGFFSSETHAVPFNAETMQLRDNAVALQFSASDMDTAPTFDLDSLQEEQ